MSQAGRRATTSPFVEGPAATRSVTSVLIGMTVLQLGTNVRASVPALIAQASPFAKVVLVVLLVMSVYSWAIIWNRVRLFQRVRRADAIFLQLFRKRGAAPGTVAWGDLHPQSILAKVAAAGQRAAERPAPAPAGVGSLVHVQHAMERVGADEISQLEKHVGFLATTGSVAPFIGLMGTVWGVMAAFLGIGAQGSATLVVVAPGIAEALIATVAGLGAAIPAVVAYNYLVGRLREFNSTTAAFVTEFLDRHADAGVAS
jgi:biopolymer transport protein TolQ